MREQLKELTKQYDKSENDLKALQSVGQVCSVIVQFIICEIRVSYPVLLSQMRRVDKGDGEISHLSLNSDW